MAPSVHRESNQAVTRMTQFSSRLSQKTQLNRHMGRNCLHACHENGIVRSPIRRNTGRGSSVPLTLPRKDRGLQFIDRNTIPKEEDQLANSVNN
ncbi:hypothetical protein TNCV_5096161 [Trichonephila clavipes]|nr:hypothetical protein TNCV_5096161 [Trichonephila clavipes]